MAGLAKAHYLIYVGLATFSVGVLYDLFFIGLPSQDPSPQMIEERNRQYLIKEYIELTGLILLFPGVIGWFIKRNLHKHS